MRKLNLHGGCHRLQRHGKQHGAVEPRAFLSLFDTPPAAAPLGVPFLPLSLSVPVVPASCSAVSMSGGSVAAMAALVLKGVTYFG